MDPVGQQLFAFQEFQRMLRPKNLIAYSIRAVQQLVIIQRQDSGLGYIEIRVMGRDDAILPNRALKFRGSIRSTRDYRITVIRMPERLRVNGLGTRLL